MGLFDLFKKKASPSPTVPADHATAGRPAQEGTTVVPDGHSVVVHGAALEPSVTRTAGGVVIGSFGAAGDDPDRELEAIVGAVQNALEQAGPLTNLVDVNRELAISELFAPNDLEVYRVPSPVCWVFHRGSCETMCASPGRAQALLRAMYGISKRAAAHQAVYLVGQPSPAARAFTRLARGLGVEVRQPDEQAREHVLFVEVTRPEGIVLCALAGPPCLPDEPPDDYALTINREKDRAEAEGNRAEHERLEERERADLERCLDTKGAPSLPLRAPLLRRFVLELGTGDRDLSSFVAALLTRTTPLVFMRSASDGGIQVRGFGGAGPTLPMYADLCCLQWAAEDLAMDPGTFGIAGILPADLIMMAADGEIGVSIGTYRNRNEPVYGILDASAVATAARSLRKRSASP